MSARYDDDDDDFDNGEDNSPAGLRKALKKALAEAKKAQDDLAAEKAARTAAEKTVKKSTLKEILESKGIKPGLTRWLEKDDVDATPEAVDAWVKENGEFFNIQPVAEQQQQQADQEQHGEESGDQLPDDLVAALQASAQLDASGVAPSQVGTMQRIQSLSTDPRKVSWDELVNGLKDAGAPLV